MDIHEQRVAEEACTYAAIMEQERERRENAREDWLDDFEERYPPFLERNENPCTKQENEGKQERRNKPGNVIPGNFGQGQAEERSGMKKRLKKLFDNLAQNQQDAVERLLALPPDQLEHALDAALSAAFEDAAQTTPPAFEEIADQYTPYPAGQQMTVESITAHLEDQLGPYLKAFGAPEDHIYLNEFQKIEPQWQKMYDKLRYEHRKDPENPLLPDLIPKVSVRVDKEIAHYSEAEAGKGARIRQSQRNRNKAESRELSIG